MGNKLVMVVGSSESGHDSLPAVGSRISRKLKFDRIAIRDILHVTGNSEVLKDAEAVSKIRQKIYDETEKKLVESFRKNRNVIMNGSFVSETPHGFIPIITHDFFTTFTPDAIILLEIHIDKKIPRKVEEIEKLKSLEKEQELNRYYAGLYSSVSGSLLKIVTIKTDKVKDAIKEVKNTINFVFGD